MTIKKIFNEKKVKKVKIKAWVISIRGNDNIRFLILNDGSSFKNIQTVLKGDNAKKISNLRIGSAVFVEGNVKLTHSSNQSLELEVIEVKILKQVDKDFPLQNQLISKEKLRDMLHLRHRTNLFRAIMKVRSTLFFQIHNFFREEGFLNISTPIITSNDGEGVGETFIVDSEAGNFFDKKATLGVTGQLQAESYANGFGNVYSFGPTFRAENSHTKKHASEFWMLEPEMAFTSKDEIIEFADKMLKVIIKNTLNELPDEFDFFEKHVDKNIRNKLKIIIEKDISKISYTNVIEELKKVKEKFDFKEIEFGIDLATEHERYIAEEVFKGPVAVVDYPKNIKAFYMKLNSDKKTVGAFDILFPGIGEIVGGSERECSYHKLKEKVQEKNINLDDIKWYLDLRRFGHYQSSGFGLGFERLIMYITGIENIRDVIPYPRTPNNLKM